MALTFGKGNRSIAFAPTAAFPLNANSYFESYDLALAAARTAAAAGDTNTKYYFGQEIAVAEMIDNVPQSAKLYIIAPETVDGVVRGTLQEVGSATDGDGQSIELVDGVLSIKGFGTRYYKYVAETEDVAAHYEPVDVDDEHVWAAGLEPRVVKEGDEYVIGWFEPNPTTVEGVQDQVVAVQGDVEQAKKDIDAVEENLVKAEEKIDSINDTLYGTEGEEAVEGLVDQVAGLVEDLGSLQDEVDALEENVYTKEEIDGLVSGVFHYRGSKASYEELPSALNNKIGDVWQVEDKEWAWNGEEWVELGFTIDLSAYATKEYVDAEVKEVQDAVDAHEEAVNAKVEEIEGAISNVADDVVANGELISANAEDIAENTRLIGVNAEAIAANGELIAANAEAITTNGELIAANAEAIAANGELIAQVAADLEASQTAENTAFEAVDGRLDALEGHAEDFESRIGDLEDFVGTPATLQTALFPAVEALQSRIDGLVAVGGEANLINGLTINGTALVPNSEKIVDLPIYAGSTAGLVPVADASVTTPATFALNAEGNWFDVASLIDTKIEEAFVWEEI